MEIKKVALIGAGAIGCVYGYYLYKAFGEDFALVANGNRKQKIEAEGIYLNDEKFTPKVISSEDEFEADLIILSVKNYQLDQAIEDIKPFVTEKTILLPLLNGIVARDVLKEAFPQNTVLYGLAIKIDAVKVGNRVTNTGEALIQFGDRDNTVLSEEVIAVRDAFEKATIVYKIFDDMLKIVWNKWMLNIGVNQVTAIAKATYHMMNVTEELQVLMKKAMAEVVEVSKAVGVNLSQENIDNAQAVIQSIDGDGKTSMFQDVDNKRKTEVDYFSGTLIELGKKYNVATPVNEVLYNFIKAIEKNYNN